MISTYVRWNQSQQVSIEMIKHHSNREQTLVPTDIGNNEVAPGGFFFYEDKTIDRAPYSLDKRKSFVFARHYRNCFSLRRRSLNTTWLKPCIIFYSIEIGWLTLFNSLASHRNYAAMCSFTIMKTGKKVDLGLFIVISPLFIRFYDWKLLGAFRRLTLLVLWGSFLKKFNHSWEYRQKTGKSRYFFPSHMFKFHSLV